MITARRISIGDALDAMPSNLVLRGDDAANARNVAALVERARRIASSIVKNARKTARAGELRSAAARRVRETQAEQAFAARALALDEAYRLAQASLMARMEEALDQVLAAALRRIGAQLPAEQRLRIVCEELAKAAGDTPAARLQLCHVDESIYRRAGIRAPWPIDVDDALAPGQCRLVANDGEWVLGFDALIVSLAPVAMRDGPRERESVGQR